jgi:glycosyltransferase involved in cell wall biosynthesis
MRDTEMIELSVILPCLNEAETLSKCVRTAQRALETMNVSGEVVVADNGSTDGSPEIAREAGACVVHIKERGYGAALRGGISHARGRYVIMGDCDGSYDLLRLDPFMEKLRAGYDLVMGNRFSGGIQPGAMPVLHKYLGNPILSRLGQFLYDSPCGDFHCGLRGISSQAFTRLHLHSVGMEFASEMVVQAALHGLRVTEVPIMLWPHGRSRPSHLRAWSDGLRHLRLLLMHCPAPIFRNLYSAVTVLRP